MPLEPRALGRGRIAGADGDRRGDARLAPGGREPCDAGQRGAEVALDVDRQRLQRRDIQHAAARFARWRGAEHEPVQAPQERGEGLP